MSFMRRRRPGRLQVFVQRLTRDAPAPVGVTAPDHEKAPSYLWGIRAPRPAHPARTSLRRCKVLRPEGRVGNDLHRGDHDRRCGDKERVSSLDRRDSGSDEDRILCVVVNPGRRVGRFERIGESFFSAPNGGDVGRRQRHSVDTTSGIAVLPDPHSAWEIERRSGKGEQRWEDRQRPRRPRGRRREDRPSAIARAGGISCVP